MARKEGSKDKKPRAKRGSTTIYTEQVNTRVSKRVRKGMYKVTEPMQKFINDAIEQALVQHGYLKEQKK